MDNNYITSRVDNQIKNINENNNIYEVGTVTKVTNFIVEISGLDNIMFYEKVNIEDKAFGYVSSIKENIVVVALLKIYSPISVGDKASATNELYKGSYSNSSMGRVIDLFGTDKLSDCLFDDLVEIPIERPTIPIMDRIKVDQPLLTGIIGIDLMYPIGKGQRQLIIGDKRTGKTQIGLDTIVNQKDKNVICIYVAIGKTKKEVKNIYYDLMKRGALNYTIIVTAFNDELSPVISLIPYYALSISEEFLMQGKDVLVVIDDLKRHAEAYREISLLSGKSPGRDAYPSDIFYTHSRLLEKGCHHKNGGSITILPITETKGGDITDYISTNLISITDGQIVLSAKNFQKGEKPAIDYGLSVSRLGGQVQDKKIKDIGNYIRNKLLSYLETRQVYELVNTDDMSNDIKNKFMEGKVILNNLVQYKYTPKTPEEIISIFQEFTQNINQTVNNENNGEVEQVVQSPSTINVEMNESQQNINNIQEQIPESVPEEVIQVPNPVEEITPVNEETPQEVIQVTNPVEETTPVSEEMPQEAMQVTNPVEETTPVMEEAPQQVINDTEILTDGSVDESDLFTEKSNSEAEPEILTE